MNNFDDIFNNRFINFGVNKKREIKRLIFEISKIDNISPILLLNSLQENKYSSLKKQLLIRRYDKTFNKVPTNAFYLPKYEVDSALKANIDNNVFYPKNIYYENLTANSEILSNVRQSFPNSVFTEIETLKDFCKEKKFSIQDYNTRCNNLFLIKEKYDFCKSCPCTDKVINCGYSLINLGMGCPFECSYCFLQGYQNTPGIIIPVNIKDYLTDDKIVASMSSVFDYKRIGSGEWTDSLAFDNITQFSKSIYNYFKERIDLFFEFKTKSINIDNLLLNEGVNNIVISWSINSFKVAQNNEFKSASISERLQAAKICAQAGFSIGFHFDPIFYYENWQQEYKEITDMIFDTVPPLSIKWISLGTLRMPATLKTIIENRFPASSILNSELLLGKDYKLRYEKDCRIEIYRFMNEVIKSKKSKTIVYLCMETLEVWKSSGLDLF